jgi:hypothetical protein
MATFQLFILPEFETWLKTQSVSRLIKLVQNHHTYIPNYSHFHTSNHLALQESMERSHLERGFAQIAQHFTTFPDGKIMTGRPLNAIPAGIKGANANGICIENLGNFDKGGDQMTAQQSNTILKLNALLVHKCGLVPSEETIVYHHWYDLNSAKQVEEGTGVTKSCPGTNFFGGNTKANFNTGFLPLVQSAYQELNFPSAVVSNHKLSGLVNVKILNVRLSSSLDSPISTKLGKGTEIRIFEDLNGWYSINQSRTRWVKKEFVDLISPSI